MFRELNLAMGCLTGHECRHIRCPLISRVVSRMLSSVDLQKSLFSSIMFVVNDPRVAKVEFVRQVSPASGAEYSIPQQLFMI